VWREGGDLEKLSGGHGRGEEGRRKRKRRRERGTDGGGRECGEERKELLRTSVEVVQSAFIERAYRNC